MPDTGPDTGNSTKITTSDDPLAIRQKRALDFPLIWMKLMAALDRGPVAIPELDGKQ